MRIPMVSMALAAATMLASGAQAVAQVPGPDRSTSPGVHRRETSGKSIIREMIGSEAAKTVMTRLRGCCARGRPLADKVPHGHRRMLTFLAALRCDRKAATRSVEATWRQIGSPTDNA